MRVLNRKDFLALPADTIYAKGQPWAFTGLRIKGDTIGINDWAYLDPAWVSANDSGEASCRLDEMLGAGASYPMEEDYGRDGCFDEDEVFLVFERTDLEKLRGMIDAALSTSEAEAERSS